MTRISEAEYRALSGTPSKRCINCKHYESDSRYCMIHAKTIKYPYADNTCRYYLNYFKEDIKGGKS